MRDIDDTLRKYADLTIRVGLNLQPGQRLAIIGPLANGGVSLDAAPQGSQDFAKGESVTFLLTPTGMI